MASYARDHADHISTRQYARLVDEWVTGIGLRREDYGAHSLRRTKASIIYKQTGTCPYSPRTTRRRPERSDSVDDATRIMLCTERGASHGQGVALSRRLCRRRLVCGDPASVA